MAELQTLRLLGVNKLSKLPATAPCVALGRNGAPFRNPGELGLRLVGAKKLRLRHGVTRNALAVDTDVSTRADSPSAWEKFRTLVGNSNQTLQKAVKLNHWVVRDYDKLVNAVNGLEGYVRSLSDGQLREKTGEFQERLKQGELRVSNWLA